MENVNMNCIFNASCDEKGSFNANFDNGNIYYSICIMNAAENQEAVMESFSSFIEEVSSKIAALNNAGFLPVKETVAYSNEEEYIEEELEEGYENGLDEPII